MMKSPFGNVAYIHGRALAHRLQTFKYLYTIRGILLFRLFHLFFLNHLISSNKKSYKYTK